MSDNEHATATDKLTSRVMAEFAYHHDRVVTLLMEIDDHADAMARQLAEARQTLEDERRDHHDELMGMERQIDYACRYGERDRSMGQPQPRRPTIHERLAEANARAETAERKIELYEWMAYQRRRNPGISDEDIMRLTYVPEWREEAAS